jgi:hypothetical protein
LKKGSSIFETTGLGINDFIGSVLFRFHCEKIGGPHFSDRLVDGKVLVREKRERGLVRFSVNLDLIGRIACADTNDLDLSP